MESAIVLDGHLKSALSVIRSLGAKNIAVSVGAERKTAMGLHSRYTQSTFVYPSPYTHQNDFVASVKKEAIRLGGKPVIYALSDATYLSLYAKRDMIVEYVTLVFPDTKSVDIAFDKAGTYSLAHVSGIPTIHTLLPETREEVVRMCDTLVFPLVLKPRHSVAWKDGVGVFGSALFIQTHDELVSQFVELKELYGESPIIQKFIFGEEYGVEMLCNAGSVYACIAHHRIRSLSPTGGASVLKETLHEGELKHTMESYAHILVQKLSWTGPIMIEFKVDADTHTPYLMEINGRFWGSLPLSCASGVDMPYLYYRAGTEHYLPEQCVTGREGVVSIHFIGDLLHLIRALFKRDPMRSLLYPRRLKAIRDFLLLPLGVKNDVWRWNDPMPAFVEVVDVITKAVWK